MLVLSSRSKCLTFWPKPSTCRNVVSVIMKEKVLPSLSSDASTVGLFVMGRRRRGGGTSKRPVPGTVVPPLYSNSPGSFHRPFVAGSDCTVMTCSLWRLITFAGVRLSQYVDYQQSIAPDNDCCVNMLGRVGHRSSSGVRDRL